LGGMKSTAASQGWCAWRMNHLTDPVLVHGNEAAIALERESMHSGRQEALRLGHVAGPLAHYDFSSYYPTLAASPLLPARLSGYAAGRCPDPAALAAKGYVCTARVLLSTADPDYPYTGPDGTLWPVGTFVTTLAHAELMSALAAGAVQQVRAVAWYEPAPVLQSIMAHLVSQRRIADSMGLPGAAAALKATANMTFGRIAGGGLAWIPCPEVGSVERWAQFPEYDAEHRRWDIYRVIAGRVFKRINTLVSAEACPALTAHVWAAGRGVLADVLRTVGRWHAVYLGTDAIVVLNSAVAWVEEHAARMPAESPQLRLVRMLDWMRVYGPGHYDTPGERHHTGVPVEAVGDWQEGYVWESPQKVEESIVSSLRPTPVMVVRGMRKRGTGRHGIETGDGRVEPIRLNKAY